MAKFCMFCGQSLPDAALFCPSCGNKQQVEDTKPKNEEIIEEEDSDELDLLSQFGYIKPKQPKKPPFAPTSKKEEVEKPTPKESEQSLELEMLTKTYNKETSKKETVVETPVKKDKVQEKKVEETSKKIELTVKKEENKEELKEKNVTKPLHKESIEIKKETSSVVENTTKTENTQKDIQKPKARRQSVRHGQTQTESVPFKPTESRKNENAMPVMEEKEEKYELPEDFSITDNESDEFCSLDEMLDISEKMEEEKKLKEELEQKKQAKKEELEAISAKKPQKGARGFFRKRKETVNVDEEEEFKTELTSVDGGKTMMEKETLYADEIADNEKYKETSTDSDMDEDTDERTRTGEGRKQVQTNTKQRRKSARSSDIDKKVYNIEHDQSEMDPEELEYDGYYENVLPIDYDSLEKQKINPKIVLAVLGGIAIFALAVWIVIVTLGI